MLREPATGRGLAEEVARAVLAAVGLETCVVSGRRIRTHLFVCLSTVLETRVVGRLPHMAVGHARKCVTCAAFWGEVRNCDSRTL